MRPKMETEVENVFITPKQPHFNNHLKYEVTLGEFFFSFKDTASRRVKE